MNIVHTTKITGYCLVTGSSRGIGKAIALEWASKGVPVIAVANDMKALTSLKSEIESTYGVDCLIVNKDLLKLESPKEIYEWCIAHEKKVQVLINNIGLGASGSFQETRTDFDLSLVQLNIFPMLQLTKLFLPMLKTFKKSYVLNMSSLGGFSPVPYKAIYTASKAFVYSFSKAISSELKCDNVQVSVSCPAGVFTNPEVVERIYTGGIIARWTSLNATTVAHYLVEGMLKGKKMIIPGVGAKLLMIFMRIVPETLNSLIVGGIMKKTKSEA